MVVLPGLDLIVSWNDTRIEGREQENGALKRLIEAVVPRGLSADPEHPQWLRRADGKPFFMCGPGDPED